jgi:hypothetical protein
MHEKYRLKRTFWRASTARTPGGASPVWNITTRTPDYVLVVLASGDVHHRSLAYDFAVECTTPL